MSVSSADLIDEQKASYQKACYRRNKPSARSSRPAPLKKETKPPKPPPKSPEAPEAPKAPKATQRTRRSQDTCFVRSRRVRLATAVRQALHHRCVVRSCVQKCRSDDVLPTGGRRRHCTGATHTQKQEGDTCSNIPVDLERLKTLEPRTKKKRKELKK